MKTPHPRRRWRPAATAFVTMFLVGLGGGVAFAGQATSADGFYTVAGHQYKNRAVINTGSSSAYAVTINGYSSGSTPSGKAGARGRLFTSGGSLVCESQNQYNSGTGNAVASSCSKVAKGAWYSYGVALGWNGSGYNSFYTYKSPNQNTPG